MRILDRDLPVYKCQQAPPAVGNRSTGSRNFRGPWVRIDTEDRLKMYVENASAQISALVSSFSGDWREHEAIICRADLFGVLHVGATGFSA
jgi:hypothetical protein